MWDRTILKSNARQALSGGRYWTAYAVCVITSLITSIFSVIKSFFETRPLQYDITMDPVQEKIYLQQYINTETWTWLPNLLLVIFVSLPLGVGIARFFVRNRFGETRLETPFSVFRSGYANTVGAQLSTEIILILWTFLLIIPGIVKAMEYSMVRFIFSDNPYLSGSRAREISRMMTAGEKGAIFVLYLSFLGWYVLGGIAISFLSWLFWPIMGLASVIVTSLISAYQEATFAELYIFLRDRAIRSGMVRPGELGLSPSAI
jgi:hypothetical protein